MTPHIATPDLSLCRSIAYCCSEIWATMSDIQVMMLPAGGSLELRVAERLAVRIEAHGVSGEHSHRVWETAFSAAQSAPAPHESWGPSRLS